MYKVKFVTVDTIRLELDMLEEHRLLVEKVCDYFTLEFVPGCEFVKLRMWNYKETGPQVVTDQYEQIEDFEFEDLVTGDRYALNAFNDLFWKLKK